MKGKNGSKAFVNEDGIEGWREGRGIGQQELRYICTDTNSLWWDIIIMNSKCVLETKQKICTEFWKKYWQYLRANRMKDWQLGLTEF